MEIQPRVNKVILVEKSKHDIIRAVIEDNDRYDKKIVETILFCRQMRCDSVDCCLRPKNAREMRWDSFGAHGKFSYSAKFGCSTYLDWSHIEEVFHSLVFNFNSQNGLIDKVENSLKNSFRWVNVDLHMRSNIK